MDLGKVSYADYICGWNRQVMKFLGIWPQERKFNRISSYLVILPIAIILLFMCLPQTINLYFVWDDFDLVVENLSVGNIIVTIALIKIIIFWISGRSLKNLLSVIEKDREETIIEEEVRRMTRIARLCRLIIMGSILSAQTITILQASIRLLFTRSNGRLLLVQSYFPYDALVTPNYEITVTGQIIAGYLVAISYASVDTFLIMTVQHTCGQFSNLREKLRNLRPGREFRVQLARIINKHVSLRRFVDTIEKQFNRMLLCQMVGCTVQLCIQSFHTILTITGEKQDGFLVEMAFFAVFISYVLVQIYLYCYIGEQLHTESTGMVQAAYECNWSELSPNETRCLVIIMRGAQMPLQLTAGKFCSWNHELFSAVLKTSMSYLSVLYAMKTNDE